MLSFYVSILKPQSTQLRGERHPYPTLSSAVFRGEVVVGVQLNNENITRCSYTTSVYARPCSELTGYDIWMTCVGTWHCSRPLNLRLGNLR